ncbi:MAG TPA: hypothetical protein VGW75_09375 [Solirubrobacteraceae bacterium]|nr:hypothetical protein [Solirubrobacteraceae bacterium]
MALYVLASTFTGAAAGAARSALGALIPADGRAAAGSLLAIAGVVLGLAGLLGRALRPALQCDRETPQRWVHEGRVQWAVKNGAALGFGAGTRLGFVLWYAVPAGALLIGNPAAGAAVYGAYGLARAGGAGAIWLAARRSGDFDPLLDWLGRRQERARTVTTAYLFASSAIILGLVGL